ncbi:WXG100 family type VII secretion target [Paenibacillus sp. F411]|uniref:ESAT-6-like protein n=1 Tax=Paenibacillus algicola TaxID=2565926 RepID=A0A4P8XGK2_9BACL|nr:MULTISPECIES: WXG100 family type VII secretion target [Paenibacillus]MBO2945171.1 WXG100 family type VII secretion target [Paenibacillus sp. F411]QCT01627.1 hypothetical protein E6C60_0907 [Paenibacillus algicola]
MSRIIADIAALERAASHFAAAGQQLGQIAGEPQKRKASIEWSGRAEQKYSVAWNESERTLHRLTALASQMASQCQGVAEALRRADEEERRREREGR